MAKRNAGSKVCSVIALNAPWVRCYLLPESVKVINDSPCILRLRHSTIEGVGEHKKRHCSLGRVHNRLCGVSGNGVVADGSAVLEGSWHHR